MCPRLQRCPTVGSRGRSASRLGIDPVGAIHEVKFSPSHLAGPRRLRNRISASLQTSAVSGAPSPGPRRVLGGLVSKTANTQRTPGWNSPVRPEAAGAHSLSYVIGSPRSSGPAPSAAGRTRRARVREHPLSHSRIIHSPGYFTVICLTIPCMKCGLPSLASGTKQYRPYSPGVKSAVM